MTLSKHDRECFSVLCWYIVEQWKPIIVRKSGLSSTCKTSHLDSFGKWSDIMEIQQILCDRAEPWSQLQYLGTQVKVTLRFESQETHKPMTLVVLDTHISFQRIVKLAG